MPADFVDDSTRRKIGWLSGCGKHEWSKRTIVVADCDEIGDIARLGATCRGEYLVDGKVRLMKAGSPFLVPDERKEAKLRLGEPLDDRGFAVARNGRVDAAIDDEIAMRLEARGLE